MFPISYENYKLSHSVTHYSDPSYKDIEAECLVASYLAYLAICRAYLQCINVSSYQEH